MLTFLIVLIVMTLVFWLDFGALSRGCEARAVVFYSTAAAVSLAAFALHCFEIVDLLGGATSVG